MQHSTRTDSFCAEDERFFGSYEAEPVGSEGVLTLEFDAVEDQPPTPARLAHLTRFRKPVAWLFAALSSFSIVALGQNGLQQISRDGVVAHVGSPTLLLSSAAAKRIAAFPAVPSRSAFARAAEQTSQAPWSKTELADGSMALVLEPRSPSISGGKRSSSSNSATQVSLVNDFTSALLSMCRNAAS